jgi:hypothetical protein
MDREGTIEPVGAPVRPYRDPDLSPDGTRIVVDIEGKAWIYYIGNGILEVLPGTDRSRSFTIAGGIGPKWSPDSSRIAFIVGASRLYTSPADGTGGADLVWDSPLAISRLDWSPDGESIVGQTLVAESGFDVWRVSLDDGQPAPYLQGPDDTSGPTFSPLGSWVAYRSPESGPSAIYARPFPDSAGKRVQISAGEGFGPLWFKGELLFRRGRRVWSVRIEETATNLEILSREQLAVVFPDGASYYDYDPVNGRFLVARPVIGSQSPRIRVVLNWFEEISARMGARR